MSVLVNPYGFGQTEPAWSGAPGYIGSGAQSAADDGAVSWDVPYPSDVQYHDILILHTVLIEGTSGTPTLDTPSGWNVIDVNTIGGVFFATGIWWKRADGTETGSLTVTRSTAGDAHNSVMSNFRGCLSAGTPYEALGTAGGTSATPTSSSITTTGIDRLVCDFISKQSISSPTSTPAAGWTERYDLPLAGNRGSAIVLDTIGQATAATVSGEASTSSVSSRWRCISFALLPR